MLMTIAAPFAVCLIGLFVWAMGDKTKPLGLVAFGVGLFHTVALVAQHKW